jgi:hypothetical protein
MKLDDRLRLDALTFARRAHIELHDNPLGGDKYLELLSYIWSVSSRVRSRGTCAIFRQARQNIFLFCYAASVGSRPQSVCSNPHRVLRGGSIDRHRAEGSRDPSSAVERQGLSNDPPGEGP